CISIAQRAALEVVASRSNRNAPRRSVALYPEALRQLPRAVSVVTFERGAARFGVTAASLSSLSVEPPTIGLFRRRRQHIAGHGRLVRRQRARARHAELADCFGRGGVVEAAPDEFEGSWVIAASGVALRSEAIAAFECESEEVIERHGRAIVIGRIRNVLKIG